MAKSRAEVRASGKTTADELAAQEAKETLAPVEPDGDPVDGGLTGGAVERPENVGMSMTPAFTRMRTDWNGPDRDVVQQMHRGVDTLIMNVFGEVYDLYYEIYLLVRQPVVDPETSEVVTDAYGVPEWQRVPGTNSYVEDWTRLNYRERENLLFKVTTGIFRWKGKSDEMWGDAMFARAQFEEAHAHGFKALPGDKPTIDDRTAEARARAAEYRYYAVYTSMLSRKAQSLVSSVELLGQRLKDLMVDR